jgi:hypothetical protein
VSRDDAPPFDRRRRHASTNRKRRSKEIDMPNLTGITALDVGIGLAFMYLLFSLLCAAAMEGIAAIFDLRAKTLEAGLRNLLDDDGNAGTAGAPTQATPAPPPPDAGASPPAAPLSQQVLGHGLIRTQYRASRVPLRTARRGPSYLPSRMFALALLDVVAPTTPADDPMARLQTAIATSHVKAGTKNALLALAKGAGNSRDRYRELVEHWFDSSMDRVSGWYKRKTQLIVCALSLLVAVALNVNTIGIADRLTHDDPVRAAVVAQATQADRPASGESLNQVAQRIADVHKLGLPIGWHLAGGDPARADLSHHLLRTIGGWLITFLALCLGAPFWFDALSRLSGLRSVGAKPKTGGGGPAPNPA